MRPQNIPGHLLALFILTVILPPAASAERKPFDHSEFDAVLKQAVGKSGDVDFAKLIDDPSHLDAYLKQLASIDPSSFEAEEAGWRREERLALWLNAYHAAVLEIIRQHYPVGNIQDIPGVWEIRFFDVAGIRESLNSIRQSKLMGAFRDEKIHTALACSARSCPPFPAEAYTGPRVEGQLFLAARAFVNDDEFVNIIAKEKKVYLSRIFRWYERDFQLDFGSWNEDSKFSRSEFAVLSFIAHYLEDPGKVRYLEEGNYKVKYLPFEWQLRRRTAAPDTPAAAS